ncbi:hypothetical protein GGR50DRAFT_170346 [Xylaria sp. CBS 124048]|nr:hypothetical protein GGR50DRAFT_170346 [Xylaria sp. CBS 124048]
MQTVVEQLDRATMGETSPKATALAYLNSLINKRLRIHATDGRIFVGDFKCTDTDRNLVLAATYEYRQSSGQSATGATTVTLGSKSDTAHEIPARHLGLIVIPGEHIVKVEVEEFTSQVKSRYPWGSRDIYMSSR